MVTGITLISFTILKWENLFGADTIQMHSGARLPDTQAIRKESARACAAVRRAILVYDALTRQEQSELGISPEYFRQTMVVSEASSCSIQTEDQTKEFLDAYLAEISRPITLQTFLEVAEEPPKVIQEL